MANTAIIDQIISLVTSYFTYMIPIIGIMAGITFMVSWFHSVVFGAGRRTFKDL